MTECICRFGPSPLFWHNVASEVSLDRPDLDLLLLQELQDRFQTNAANVEEGGGADSAHAQMNFQSRQSENQTTKKETNE